MVRLSLQSHLDYVGIYDGMTTIGWSDAVSNTQEQSDTFLFTVFSVKRLQVPAWTTCHTVHLPTGPISYAGGCYSFSTRHPAIPDGMAHEVWYVTHLWSLPKSNTSFQNIISHNDLHLSRVPLHTYERYRLLENLSLRKKVRAPESSLCLEKEVMGLATLTRLSPWLTCNKIHLQTGFEHVIFLQDKYQSQ